MYPTKVAAALRSRSSDPRILFKGGLSDDSSDEDDDTFVDLQIGTTAVCMPTTTAHTHTDCATLARE